MVGKRLVGNLVWSVYSGRLIGGRLFEVGLLIYISGNTGSQFSVFFKVEQKACKNCSSELFFGYFGHS
jgi:hypothetical protein